MIEDAHAIKSLISYDVAQWFTLMPWPYHLSDAVEWLTHVQSAPSDPIWAITRYGQIIGMIGLDGELGYWLAPEYHAKATQQRPPVPSWKITLTIPMPHL